MKRIILVSMLALFALLLSATAAATPALAASCTASTSAQLYADVSDPSCAIVNVAPGTYFVHLTINRDVTISGAGTSRTFLDGSNNGRVITINCCGYIVHLFGLTVQHGNSFFSEGGGIYNDEGSLFLSHVVVRENYSSSGGGGIENASSSSYLELTDVTIAHNSGSEGGGIDNDGSMTLTRVRILGNIARYSEGAGVDNEGPATLTDVTIDGNNAQDSGGGGFANESCSSAGGVVMNNVTISNNRANEGAGIDNDEECQTMQLTNVTISGNVARSGTGGGIDNEGLMSLVNVTVANNSAPAGEGGGIRNSCCSDTITLKYTIVANNAGGNCDGTITSQGHNLDSGNTCGFHPSLGDKRNTNPLLGPLANNGGYTRTMALLPGSPAIDAGGSDCPPPHTDQRGVTRPQGAACDIGAYELVQ